MVRMYQFSHIYFLMGCIDNVAVAIKAFYGYAKVVYIG